MHRVYPTATPADEFLPSREKFEAVLDWLGSADAAQMTAIGLEVRIEEEGRELLRRLLQDHLDLRAVREERLPEVRGNDGQARNHARLSELALMSIHGLVKVSRLQYGQREMTSLFPADATLNLPLERYSHGLRRMVALEIARSFYDARIDSVGRYTGGKVPPRQVQELALRAAADFEAFYAGRAARGPGRDGRSSDPERGRQGDRDARGVPR